MTAESITDRFRQHCRKEHYCDAVRMSLDNGVGAFRAVGCVDGVGFALGRLVTHALGEHRFESVQLRTTHDAEEVAFKHTKLARMAFEAGVIDEPLFRNLKRLFALREIFAGDTPRDPRTFARLADLVAQLEDLGVEGEPATGRDDPPEVRFGRVVMATILALDGRRYAAPPAPRVEEVPAPAASVPARQMPADHYFASRSQRTIADGPPEVRKSALPEGAAAA